MGAPDKKKILHTTKEKNDQATNGFPTNVEHYPFFFSNGGKFILQTLCVNCYSDVQVDIDCSEGRYMKFKF